MRSPTLNVDACLSQSIADLRAVSEAVTNHRPLIEACLRDNQWHGILMKEPDGGRVLAEITAAPEQGRLYICTLRYRDQKDTHLLLKLRVDLSGDEAIVTPHQCKIIDRAA